jgi:NADP-dependent alcohol dehydrogenase
MDAFTFWNPTKIIFGKDQIAAIKNEIPSANKVLLTFGGGSIKQNGVYSQLREVLKQHTLLEFGGIEANPTYETLMKAVELVRREKIDFILAAGGGSVIDGSKFIAAAANYPRDLDPWQILIGGPAPESALPLGTILTLPATGSEMNSGSVITKNATKDKVFFASPHCFPKFSVLDPSVTFSLPERQVANGIVDAFVHVLEQYLTYPVRTEIQDRFAKTILQTLIAEGPKTFQNPTDFDSRANFMWAATMALNGLIGAGVPQDWTTHMIGHELTALFGIDHGRTLAVIMPATLKVMSETKKEKLLQYAERIWGLREGTSDMRIQLAISQTENFFRSLGAETSLHYYGVREQDLNAILDALVRHRMTRLGERGTVTIETCRRILQTAAPA